jgi:CubicO group peptidase (beta-lactamase class C family)
LARLAAIMQGHVDQGGVVGLAWVVSRRDEAHRGTAGLLEDGGPHAEPDSIFRIASMTKPVVAAAALALVEDGRLRLDEPVDRWLPELADRRVLRHPGADLDDTVAARRPISLRDLLTLRMGIGWDFTVEGPQPVMAAAADLELGSGPPAPAGPPAPDEWIRRLGTLPLAHQPGDRWLYHTSSEVLGVLIARVVGQPLEAVLAERLFEPLGMTDTGFAVPAGSLDRFGAVYAADPGTGERTLYDPADGQWSRPPAFPSGGAGLVSTIDDYLAFARMLVTGGRCPGGRVLSRPSVVAMTTNQLTSEQMAASSPSPDGTLGWGFGVAVQVARTGPARSIGSYGWDGGLGSTWANDPAEDLVGILLTNQAFTSPEPPTVVQAFWTGAYASIDD